MRRNVQEVEDAEENLSKAKAEVSQLKKKMAGAQSSKSRVSKKLDMVQMQVDNTNINAVTVSRKKLMDEIDKFDLIVMKEKLSPSISKGARYFGSKSCYKRMNNGFDNFYAEFPVNKAPASSVGKKELLKRSNFVYDVSEYVASPSKEKSETKLLLTELVRIHKPLFQEMFANSGLDTSVSMIPTEDVSMQSLLRLPTNKVRNLRHILSNLDMNILMTAFFGGQGSGIEVGVNGGRGSM